MSARTFRKSGQLTPKRNATAVFGQSRTKHIGDVRQIERVTDWAFARNRLADFSSCPLEFGVRVAHFGAIYQSCLVFGKKGSTRQSIVNVAFGGRGTWRDSKHDTADRRTKGAHTAR